MNKLEIKKLREKLGLTQKQLAKLIGCSFRTVQNWEQGRLISKISQTSLENLEKKYNQND